MDKALNSVLGKTATEIQRAAATIARDGLLCALELPGGIGGQAEAGERIDRVLNEAGFEVIDRELVVEPA